MNFKILINLLKKGYSYIDDIFKLPSLEVIEKIDWSDIFSILTALGIGILLFILATFALWIVKSIALYKMAKNKGDKFAFISFIPLGCTYIMGRIIGKTRILGIEIYYPEILLPLLILTMFLPIYSILSSILFFVFYYGILYKLYKSKWERFAVVATVISIFLPIFQPFFLFYIRNVK